MFKKSDLVPFTLSYGHDYKVDCRVTVEYAPLVLDDVTNVLGSFGNALIQVIVSTKAGVFLLED